MTRRERRPRDDGGAQEAVGRRRRERDPSCDGGTRGRRPSRWGRMTGALTGVVGRAPLLDARRPRRAFLAALLCQQGSKGQRNGLKYEMRLVVGERDTPRAWGVLGLPWGRAQGSLRYAGNGI